MSNDKQISIYLYLVLLVSQSGMQIPALSFMTGNNQIFFAIPLLIIGLYKYNSRGRIANHSIGMKFFWTLIIALFLSIIMADFFWGQDIITSMVLYRHNYMLLYILFFLLAKPSLKSISNALLAFTLTALIVWIAQAAGIFSVNHREDIWGTTMDATNEFGGYGIYGIRIIVLAFYIFISEMISKFSLKNFIKVAIALLTITFAAQRSMYLFVFPILAYAFIFKIKTSKINKLAISFVFISGAIGVLLYTSDIWISFITETTEQLGDNDYNRWKAVDFFVYKYNANILTAIFGNGFLSLRNAGGVAIQDLGYSGIFIDDIGMLCVWVRYGIIPVILIYYLIIKILKTKEMPLYLKFISIHIGLLPTSWTLVGPHCFVLVVMIYLYCLNLNKRNNKISTINTTHYTVQS